jgi:hypothetical protein
VNCCAARNPIKGVLERRSKPPLEIHTPLLYYRKDLSS